MTEEEKVAKIQSMFEEIEDLGYSIINASYGYGDCYYSKGIFIVKTSELNDVKHTLEVADKQVNLLKNTTRDNFNYSQKQQKEFKKHMDEVSENASKSMNEMIESAIEVSCEELNNSLNF